MMNLQRHTRVLLNPKPQPYIGYQEVCYDNGFKDEIIDPSINDINGGIFITLQNLSFSFIFFIIGAVPLLLPVWNLDIQNNLYSSTVCFLSKNMADLVLQIILPVIYTCICYFLLGFMPAVQEFFVFLLYLLIFIQASCSFAYFIAIISPNIGIANAIVSPLLLPMMLFGGYFLNARNVPVYLIWYKYISFVFYGNGAMLINQWSDVELNCKLCNGTVLTREECPDNLRLENETIYSSMGFKSSDYEFYVGMLVALVVFYRLLAYFALLYRFRK